MNPPGSTVTGLARYGLKSNPYHVKAVDPLTQNDVLNRTVGGAETLEAIEQYIARSVDADETAVVLIQGKSGTGRTSICNHLLRHYCDCRRIDRSELLVPTPRYHGDDPFNIFKNWLTALRVELIRKKLMPLGKETFDLNDEIKGTNLEPDTYTTYAPAVMAELTEDLRLKANARYAVCFEDIRKYSLVKMAFDIFAEARTLVLFTILEYPRAADSIRTLFKQHPPKASSVEGMHYPVLDLETLKGAGAKELIQHHWRAVASTDSPFDDEGLETAFDTSSRSAGRVMLVTGRILELRATSVGAGPEWPEDRATLEFAPDLLREWVPRLDDEGPHA